MVSPSCPLCIARNNLLPPQHAGSRRELTDYQYKNWAWLLLPRGWRLKPQYPPGRNKMANVTFSSPSMSRDVTVYAVAGDRGTLLALAKSNKIHIPFDCQDGECGSCLVEVTVLSKATHAISLTEKEKEMLKQLGKISKAEVAEAEVNDLPPHFRLACQYIIRDEDILVSFVGDETLPDQKIKSKSSAKID
jgi:ferredoxin